jgi:uncharacterized protein YndB with AHSA1/START domain
MDGTLHTVDGRPMLRFERRLPHPVGKVWRAITDPEELSGWFPWRIEMDFRIDGKISFTHPTGAVTAPDAVITELDPPRVFAYHWNDGVLRWELTPDGDDGDNGEACVLVFTHTFAERPPAAKFAAGWQLSMDALGSVLDGTPVVTAGWQDLNRRYVRAFGLLDGEIDGTELRFEQELIHPVAVVWAALAGAARLGSVPPSSAVPAGAVTELRTEESLAYPWLAGGREVGMVRFELVPQDFGTRLVLTVSADTPDRLPAVQQAWRDHLESFADQLDDRA